MRRDVISLDKKRGMKVGEKGVRKEWDKMIRKMKEVIKEVEIELGRKERRKEDGGTKNVMKKRRR